MLGCGSENLSRSEGNQEGGQEKVGGLVFTSCCMSVGSGKGLT